MKCIFSSQFKELVTAICTAVVALALISAILTMITCIVGYISFQWFDLALEIKASSPLQYYFTQGLELISILIVMGLLAAAVYTFVLYPIYFLIFKIKRVLNFIFTCKGN